MNSWDFFDTLCGRSCGEPWRLFEAVGGPQYVPLRQEAERRSDKTWAGIFRAFRDLSGWPADRVDRLQADEWQAEVDGAFPIVENASAVQPGDRIVSDSYFSATQIRTLADRIGIPQDVEIVASWDGKWSGRWWRSDAAAEAAIHTGDNQKSDFNEARAAGRKARLYTGGRWTAVETSWLKAGLWEIAGAARAARLQCPHESGSSRAAWWMSAAQGNVPFLLAAAAVVHDYAAAAGAGRLAFVSRDAILLGRVYQAVYGEKVQTFHASRQTLTSPSPAFVRYARGFADGTLLVDLHGTGRTVRAFTRSTGVRLNYAFVCGQRRMPPEAPALALLQGINTGTAIEVANYHDQGRVIDVDDAGRPIRDQVEYDLEVVRVQHEATMAGAALCCRPPVGVQPRHVTEAADVVRRLVPRQLMLQHQVHHAIRPAAGR